MPYKLDRDERILVFVILGALALAAWAFFG